MQISSVLNGYTDAANSGRRSDVTERAANRLPTTAVRGLSGPANSALGDIMADYDLTEITPEQYSEMLNRLRKEGAITEEEYTQLAQVRTELDHEGIASNETIDLLSVYRSRVAKLAKQAGDTSVSSAQRATYQQVLSGAQHRLDWLEKLELVHTQPDSIGLDAVA
jgi:hypothetical protein